MAEEIERAGKVTTYPQDVAIRFGWVQRHIPQGQKVLDIGCGQDQPLLYVLGARNYPKQYVGVDLNRITRKSNVKWATIYDQFDFVNNSSIILEKHGRFNVVTCFEVAEHMEPADLKVMLGSVRVMMEDDATFFLSTPVFNGLAAANHIHEYRTDELRQVLEEAGFTIKAKYGTFASKPDLTYVMSPEHRKIYNELEGWFGGEVMATILAPLYPDQSRNICWVLQKAQTPKMEEAPKTTEIDVTEKTLVVQSPTNQTMEEVEEQDGDEECDEDDEDPEDEDDE